MSNNIKIIKIPEGKITLSVKFNKEWNEWFVEYRLNGKVDEDKSYYTLSSEIEAKQDAFCAMECMVKEIVNKMNGIEING